MLEMQRPLMLYDAGCRFCRGSARLIARLDGAGRFSFLPMLDERAEPFARLVPEADRFKSFHIIEPSGRTYSRGAAVIMMLSTLPATRWVGTLARVLHLGWLMNLGYAAVARSRGFLGRAVKDAPGPVRWP